MKEKFIRKNLINLSFIVLSISIFFINPNYIFARSENLLASVKQTTSQMWPSRYNGVGNAIDIPYDVLTDKNGYVYVTGASYDANGTMLGPFV